MVISDVTKYKGKIMNKLCSIPDILTLINNPDIIQTKPDNMRNVNIFSYMKIPNTTLTVKNYICFDYNSRVHNYNDSFKNVTINISVICHESTIQTSFGNRHDAISGMILEAFNWSDFLGYTLELVSDTENILEREYHVRNLQFKNVATNNIHSGVRSGVY